MNVKGFTHEVLNRFCQTFSFVCTKEFILKVFRPKGYEESLNSIDETYNELYKVNQYLTSNFVFVGQQAGLIDIVGTAQK